MIEERKGENLIKLRKHKFGAIPGLTERSFDSYEFLKERTLIVGPTVPFSGDINIIYGFTLCSTEC